MTRRSVPLRRRLVVGIAGLLAAVTLIIGVLSVLALQSFLIGRLDTQLTAATGRTQDAFEGERPERPDDDDFSGDRPPASQFLALPGQGAGTLAGIISAGSVYNAAVLEESGAPTPLTADQIATLATVPVGQPPQTVDLGEGLGAYRVVVQPTSADGDSLVIGLPLDPVNETVLRLALLIGGIGLLGVVGTAIVGAVVVRLALRPLERVAATATRVSELTLDRGEVALAVRVSAQDADPATEVGTVGAALNRLLEHVAAALTARQASENKVRTFVADASHELRTPLASIRGYAELTRRGGHDLPDDVVHAIGRVESESVRMTGLVEDLLLLARLDENAPLEAREVDLTALVIDAVSDARAVSPEHHWQLEMPEEPVTVRGDASRLHQVVANLLANARIHTPVGTTVTAAVLVETGRAIVEVRDTGPGIDPALTPTIFERFVRGDSSRARATGSTGLGLAIVSAVVEAHGGRAEVESAAGMTVFRVTLPRTA
jgi:two-component system OmpR family sensor kinase